MAIDDDSFVIPNFNLYCNFVDYCRRQMGQPSGLPLNQMAKFFVGSGKLALSLTRPSADEPDMEIPEIVEVVEATAHRVVNCDSNDDIPERFAELLTELQRSG